MYVCVQDGKEMKFQKQESEIQKHESEGAVQVLLPAVLVAIAHLQFVL